MADQVIAADRRPLKDVANRGTRDGTSRFFDPE
jgi:hypothetical protein